jgi:hypothetical protein
MTAVLRASGIPVVELRTTVFLARLFALAVMIL